MITATTHVSTKYQVVIPKKVRQGIKLAPYDSLVVSLNEKNEIVLKKPITSIFQLRGSYHFPKNYLKKERASWK